MRVHTSAATRTVAVFSKPSKPDLGHVARDVVEWLKAHGYRVVVDPEASAHAREETRIEREQMAAEKPEFAVVLGGDGTILAAARSLSHAGVPILGVNLGSLGFLAEVPLTHLYQTLEAVKAGRYQIEERAMLEVEMRGRNKQARFTALNDVVVKDNKRARMGDFDVWVGDEFVSNYKADGVIVSTPTGSTAYSLAAGGPILLPGVGAFVITPVSPHALTNRPLVIRDTEEIKIKVGPTDDGSFLTVDGQVGEELAEGDQVLCRKSATCMKLIRMPDRTFFDILRSKLKWGER
jgi:NAD+ kinase